LQVEAQFLTLTASLRSSAQQLINQVVETELEELLSQYSDQRTDAGSAVAVRNGHLPEPQLHGPVPSVNPND